MSLYKEPIDKEPRLTFASSLQLYYNTSLSLNSPVCKMGMTMSVFQGCYHKKVRLGV